MDADAPVLLMASTQHWDSPFQIGSHHIARCFADRGWRVGFVSAPIGPQHLAGLGRDAAARVASWRAGGTTDPASGIWHHVPFAPLPWGTSPVLRGRAAVQLGWRLCRPLLAATLCRAGFDQPRLVYVDHFLHEGLLHAAEPAPTVYRRADDVAAFPGAASDFAARDLDFARRAALTVCPTATAARHLAEHGVPQPLVVPNGLRLDRFFDTAPVPAEYAGDARPVVVYVGEAVHRFDAALAARAVAALPACRWVFIGPFDAATAQPLRAAGAEVLGPRPHAALAGYLQHARVGIVPFSRTRNQALIREVSPLKVLEYAASGLPVVGTAGCQYPGDLPTPLAVCDDDAAFVEAVAAFARAPRPPRPARAAFEAFDWQARLAPLFGWLAQRGMAVERP